MGQENPGRKLHKRASILSIPLFAKPHYRCRNACTTFASGMEATQFGLTEDWPNIHIFDWKRVSVRLKVLL